MTETTKIDFESMTIQEATKYFKEKLGTDMKWVRRALIVLLEKQTAAERQMGATVEHNGVGFTGADAEILTSFAQKAQQPGYIFSEKQCKCAFKLMPKYAGQLVRIMRAKQGK